MAGIHRLVGEGVVADGVGLAGVGVCRAWVGGTLVSIGFFVFFYFLFDHKKLTLLKGPILGIPDPWSWI